MGEAHDFLNPKSMSTPGVAGAVVMLIANTLWSNFAIEPRWTALALSFLLGLVILAERALPAWQRLIFYVVNSLIIFSVSLGTNQLGMAVTSERSVETGAVGKPGAVRHEFFRYWL
jgi:hypothetical protein